MAKYDEAVKDGEIVGLCVGTPLIVCQIMYWIYWQVIRQTVLMCG